MLWALGIHFINFKVVLFVNNLQHEELNVKDITTPKHTTLTLQFLFYFFYEEC